MSRRDRHRSRACEVFSCPDNDHQSLHNPRNILDEYREISFLIGCLLLGWLCLPPLTSVKMISIANSSIQCVWAILLWSKLATAMSSDFLRLIITGRNLVFFIVVLRPQEYLISLFKAEQFSLSITLWRKREILDNFVILSLYIVRLITDKHHLQARIEISDYQGQW